MKRIVLGMVLGIVLVLPLGAGAVSTLPVRGADQRLNALCHSVAFRHHAKTAKLMTACPGVFEALP